MPTPGWITLLLLGTFYCSTEASRILFPSDSAQEFETPILTNSIYGGPPNDFNATANVTTPAEPCSDYDAFGFIVVLDYTSCDVATQIDKAIKAGSVAILIDMTEPQIIGRFANVPLANHPIKFPLFMFGRQGSSIIKGLLNGSSNNTGGPGGLPPPKKRAQTQAGSDTAAFVTIEIFPGRNQWHEEVIDTPWFMFLQVFFCAAYVTLLVLVAVKFAKKVRYSGFMWNISFAYLLIQAGFCILVLLRWLDPLISRGLYVMASESFWDLMPTSWAFVALSLMAFFWFEALNQFANTKVSPFLSKKLQIPFWIIAGFIVVLPVIDTLVEAFAGRSQITLAFIFIHLAAMFLIAAFYIIVAIKSIAIIERSKKLNDKNKKRVRNLTKSHVSIILSCIVMSTRPLLSFFLHYYSRENVYLLVVAIAEESFFFGLLLCVQVVFMPNRSPTSSTSTGGSHSANKTNGDVNKPTTTGSSKPSQSTTSQDNTEGTQPVV